MRRLIFAIMIMFLLGANVNIQAQPNEHISTLDYNHFRSTWQLKKYSAGKISTNTDPIRETEEAVKEIELIPYGCTTIRISQLPVKQSIY